MQTLELEENNRQLFVFLYYVFMQQVSAKQLSYNDFKKEEIDKIKKRMSVEFIKEYIKYINARNQYNNPPHTKEELKQKVMDYAKHANIDPSDNKKIIAQSKETIQTNKKIIGAGAHKSIFEREFTIGKKTKTLVEATRGGFTMQSIVASAMLSLLERQPKYYSLNHMNKLDTIEKENNELQNIHPTQMATIKQTARRIIMPILDDQPKNNFLASRNTTGQVDRISSIDLDEVLAIPVGVNLKYAPVNKDNQEMVTREMEKILTLQPKLMRLAITQHLRAIGCNNKTIRLQTDRGLKFFLAHLQGLREINKIFTNDAKQYQSWMFNYGYVISSEQGMPGTYTYTINKQDDIIDIPELTSLRGNKLSVYTFIPNCIPSANKPFFEILNSISRQLDSTIQEFQNYISLQESIQTKIDHIKKEYPSMKKYNEEIIFSTLENEIDNGKNIKDIKIDDIVKQIASKTNNPTLYWKAVMKERQTKTRSRKADYQKCFGERGWVKSTNTKNNINLTDITKNKELKKYLKR